MEPNDPRWREFDMFMIGDELNELISYVESVEACLKQLFSAAEKEYEEDAAKLDNDVVDMWIDWHLDKALRLNHSFPALHCSVAFVAVYSFLEDRLMIIGDKIAKHRGYAIIVNDMKGQGIEACKRFLYPFTRHTCSAVV